MQQIDKGYFVWSREEENYIKTTETLKVITPMQKIKLSELQSESIPIILQAVWCKRKGHVNHRIGTTPEQDKKIAQELDIW